MSATALAGTRSGQTELVMGDPARLRVSVTAAPMASLVSLVVDALGGPRQGVAPDWVATIRRALPADAVQVVAPMFDRSRAMLPNCLTPLGVDGSPITDQLTEIADVTPDVLADDVGRLGPGEPSQPWRTALRRPRHWLACYSKLMTAAWSAYEPLWRESMALRSRETERIGTAAVTGGLDVLLANLSRRARFDQRTLYLSDRNPYRVELADRPVRLVPLVSGTTASVFNLDEPDHVWIGYPVPGLAGLGRDRSGPGLAGLGRDRPIGSGDSLALLVGPIRAAILRALDRPMSMGRLADQLGTGRSTTTYHCDQLAAAGLVVRDRKGREVRIQRSSRGDALVDLLS